MRMFSVDISYYVTRQSNVDETIKNTQNLLAIPTKINNTKLFKKTYKNLEGK